MCRYANGRGARGAPSSLFWRFFEFGGFLTRFAFGFLTFSPFQNRPCVLGFLSPLSGEFSPIFVLFLSALRFLSSPWSSWIR
jgi:hypothetical protein